MGGSLPFRSGVVVSLRPVFSWSGLLVADASTFPWLVTVLTSIHLLLASSAASPLAVGPGFSYASCLPFALLRALGILVHLPSLLH